MLAFKNGPRVRLISRQGIDHTDRFRELADGIAAQGRRRSSSTAKCACSDKSLISSQFHLLDRAASDEPCTPPVFMVFDYLRVHGLDVHGLPLQRRRYMLEQQNEGALWIVASVSSAR